MNTGIILDYLTGLAGNNNREWYHAHKKEYQEANEEFIALLQELIWRIGEKDSSILHNDPRDASAVINLLTIRPSAPTSLPAGSCRFL